LNHICCSLSGFSPIILQLGIIHELSEGMKGCSTAFIAVAVAGIALSVAASSGMEMDDAPEVHGWILQWKCRFAVIEVGMSWIAGSAGSPS
jgi:hypothetical protein